MVFTFFVQHALDVNGCSPFVCTVTAGSPVDRFTVTPKRPDHLRPRLFGGMVKEGIFNKELSWLCNIL